jgi:hypothetical protein
MAVQTEILISELQVWSEDVIDETAANAAASACSAKLSDFDSIPSLIQHALICVDFVDDLSADEITAADAGDWDALHTAIEAHSALSGDQIALFNSRVSLISVGDGPDVIHN